MCGIAGIFSPLKPLSDSTISALKYSSTSLSHRGPDSRGTWTSPLKSISLLHQRLSIVELSDLGSQPMVSPCGRYVMVFNGEIYNHCDLRSLLTNLGIRCLSNSDSEALLNLYIHYGSHCLQYLNGMFAFCVYDKLKNELFLARDRAGEKPLYLASINNTLYFSSELTHIIKLLPCRPIINPNALHTYLLIGYPESEETLISQVSKLPPGHYCRINPNSINIDPIQYWHLPAYCGSDLSYDETKNIVIDKLSKSVNLQLQSDVGNALLLSGGIDSSILTALAARQTSQVNTFTVSFPSSSNSDESSFASIVADYFGTNHTQIDFDSQAFLNIPDIVKLFDEPIADSSHLPTHYVFSQVSKSYKVAIGGDGGDELFGGYSHYKTISLLKSVTKYLPQLPFELLAQLFRYLPIGIRGKTFSELLIRTYISHVPQRSTLFNAEEQSRLCHSHYRSSQTNPIAPARPLNYIDAATRYDFLNYLANDILPKVDRCSMLCSVEARSPFLDVNLIEFCFSSIPSHMKANRTSNKILLKDIGKLLLPPELNLNRKQGFSVDLSKFWHSSSFCSTFNDLIFHQSLFSKPYLQNLLRLQHKGFSNSHRLYAIYVLLVWLNHNHIDCSYE